MNQEIRIRNKTVNQDNLFIIAECGNQFGGSYDKAKALIDAAADAGADCIKFIFWFPDEIIANKWEFPYSHNLDNGKTMIGSLYDVLDELRLRPHEWLELRYYCLKKDIIFTSTIISPSGIDLNINLMMDCIKISSWDYNFTDLWAWAGWFGVPVLVDTGPCREEELTRNLKLLRNDNIILMHCFHTKLHEQMNMQAIPYMREKFGCPVGFASVDYNDELDIMAIGLGASVLEKRLTLDRKGGVLHDDLSKEPDEFKEYVKKMRQLKSALGQKAIIPSDTDLELSEKYFRRIVVGRNIIKGQTITRDDLEAKRGKGGISPENIWDFCGKVAAKDIAKNETIIYEHIE